MSILFKKDWRNEKGELRAIPHASTTNTSFLRTCQLLKRMGIANYAFPLALYDPDLADVDVHDLEEDTAENNILRTKVQIEARRNVWYFLRECIRIYEQGGSPVPFRLDRNSTAMTWCFINGIDYCGMAPRQAQPLDAKILTPNGWSTMDDMKIGSEVICPDGYVSKVKSIYPLGIRDIFRLTLGNGRSTKCCRDHLWRVYREDDLNSQFDILTLDEIISLENSIYIPVYGNESTLTLEQLILIDPAGRERVQCIEIDHPDHLYITDDYIVTHNTGKTVCALSLTAWIMYSSGYEYQIGHFAKDDKLRQENVKRVRALGENLPKWWMAENKFKDKKNTDELFYDALRTHYITMVAQKDKSTADLQARGASMPMIHIDEVYYCKSIGISYPTMLASTGTARENARRNGKPFSNLLTTTAGDPIKEECREAAKILAGAMPFTEHLYDLESNEKLHQIVEASSPQKMIIGIFSHLQLGYDNKWLKDKITRGNMTRDQVMRDYLNRAVSIQEDPIIPAHVLATITASEMEPKYIQILSNKFVIYWYLTKEEVHSQEFKNRPIVLGCDSSEMIGRDATTLVGADPRDLSTVCTFRCNEGNINVVGVMIAQLLLMFPKMIWVPENKSSGTSLIDIVNLILRKEGHNPFTRVFNWIVNNQNEIEFQKYNIRDMNLLDTSAKKYFGIKTDKTKRDQLYSQVLLEGAQRACGRVRDKTLIRELSSLTARNGRVDHEVGGNDDTVISWLMCLWFIMHAKHHDVYGLKAGTAMSFIDRGQSDKVRHSIEKQTLIREKLEHLEEQLKYQKDPALRKLLQSDISVVKDMLDSGPLATPMTADALHADPRKYTDPVTSEKSREKVDSETVEKSLKMLLGLS